MPTQLSSLGAAIRYNRKIKKLTQKELATKLGVHVSTIIRYENDKIIPSPSKLLSLEAILKTKFA